jgi:hypothetical protein
VRRALALLAVVGLVVGALSVWRNRMIAANERTFSGHGAV